MNTDICYMEKVCEHHINQVKDILVLTQSETFYTNVCFYFFGLHMDVMVGGTHTFSHIVYKDIQEKLLSNWFL